ncbi:hypothetical protein BKA67DRAFT_661163 [Truncatella angustata]|uniref:TeaA receptor TeaR n=1 Tax=Truncatella angustata TaxID=152316 RepID=A0A9P8UHR7_9PEZI|nr:uncharacterized protein BKA67DRAFT_661163 [Truncatella angustata]KAH6652420.1 hypothetical protein BKA67DRAFT_661163 [Truncatella angustata]
MAAMSASAPGATAATSTLTPPSSSHGNDSGWKSGYTLGGYQESPTHLALLIQPSYFKLIAAASSRLANVTSSPLQDPTHMQHGNYMNGYEDTNGATKGPLSPHLGNTDYDPFTKPDPNDPFSAVKEVRSGGRSRSRTRPDNKRANSDSTQGQGKIENDKWIHRDKLAKIESEELQAAGIVLPKPRSHSRPRRERSSEKMNGGRRGTDASEHQPMPRSRKNSTQRAASTERSPDPEGRDWDFRLPEEIAEDPNEYWISSDTLAGKSRLPVAKHSVAPVPADYVERDAPVPRKMSGAIQPDEDFMLAATKPRSRSGSATLDALEQPVLQAARRSASERPSSPRKAATGTRKPSGAPGKPAAGRPKTRSGPGKMSKDSTANTRPTTRSGELSPKAPEGDPPWMVSAYKPDPRLPPDQQLLPTVAKRLQQEQWEKEGKFGSVYDKEFRPLTDDTFAKPPEMQKTQVQEKHDEWPLRAEAKSPTPSRPGTSSYSTMPKIQDTPMLSPLASPRLPISPQLSQQQQQQQHEQLTNITRVPTVPEQPRISEKEQKKSSGCGCCVVM